MNKLKLLYLAIYFLINASFSFNTVDIEALSSFAGKWRGKGFLIKDTEKETFDVTQWVNDPRNRRISLYGYTKSNAATHQDFHKSIFINLEEKNEAKKVQISFYLKDNFLIFTPFERINDTEWQFKFEDEKGVKYRYSWKLESDNIWIETGEMQQIKDWTLFSKMVLSKQ